MGYKFLACFLLVMSVLAVRVDVTAADTFSLPVSIIKSSLNEISAVLSILAGFTGPLLGDDLRVSSAVKDCVDLLSLSSDELDWTISTASPDAATEQLSVGTGNTHYDLRTWLSAAVGNQETCAEGFQDTDVVVKSLVVGSLDTITSLVYQVLTEIPDVEAAEPAVNYNGKRKLLDAGGFPRWMKKDARRFLQESITSFQPDVTVAADGSGDYATVSEAVDAAPEQSEKRFVIHVKAGLYKENVEVSKKKWNVVLLGDGMGATIISGNRNFVDGWTTYRSATLAVSGKGFIARALTIENTAGPAKHQAVAFRSDSDLSALFQVEVLGYQDSLYAHSLRQFYRECRIAGTVDFIFGNAAAVFQGCTIIARRPLPNQKNSITAQGRKFADQNTGFSIHGCNITVEGGNGNSTAGAAPPKTYLGRPWKTYSRTVVMQSYLGSGLQPEGWLEWAGNFALDTLFYGEYMNYGPGSGLSSRVSWPGFHVITNPATAANFSVAQFIDGNQWLPETGVRYVAGLLA
ncbi:pectinesterase-like [Wolffia australiana]